MPVKAIFYATSYENSFGAGEGHFFYGRPYIDEVVLNHHSLVEFKVTEYRYLEEKNRCGTETVFEQAENIFVKNIKDQCPNPCSPVRMPKETIPFCTASPYSPDYDLKCASYVYIDAQGKVNDHQFCSKTEYEGKLQFQNKRIEGYDLPPFKWTYFDSHDEYVRPPDLYSDVAYDYNPVVKMSYRFEKPETMRIYEEYYISTFEDLVGVVGGTFGLFVGFAFSNYSFLLIYYFIIMVEVIMKFFNSKKKEVTFKKTVIKKEKAAKPTKKATAVKSNKIQDTTKSKQETNVKVEENSVQSQETTKKEENHVPSEQIKKPTVEELEMIEDAPKSRQETIVKVEETGE